MPKPTLLLMGPWSALDSTFSLFSTRQVNVGNQQIDFDMAALRHPQTGNSLTTHHGVVDLCAPNLTLVLCLTEDAPDQSFFNTLSEQIAAITRERQGMSFNILPLLICSSDEEQATSTQTQLALDTFDFLNRLEVSIQNPSVINTFNPSSIQREITNAIVVCLDTPIYQKLRQCVADLTVFHDAVDDYGLKNTVTQLKGILDFESSLGRNQGLANYLNERKEVIAGHIQAIRAHMELDRTYNKANYHARLFLNAVASIATLLSALTIVCIPLAYYALSKNLQRHNSLFKFVATNQADTLQATLFDAEMAMKKPLAL